MQMLKISKRIKPNIQIFNLVRSKISYYNDHKMLRLLDSMNIEYSDKQNGQIAVKWCPLCPKPHNYQKDNMNTLNIQRNTGLFNCFRCGSKGNFYQLRQQLQQSQIDQGYSLYSIDQDFNYNLIQPQSQPYLEQQQQIEDQLGNQMVEDYELSMYRSVMNLDLEEFRDHGQYLQEKRGINLEVLKEYRVGLKYGQFTNIEGKKEEIVVVMFPMFVGRSIKAQQKYKVELEGDDSVGIGVSNLFSRFVRAKVRGVYQKQYMKIEPYKQNMNLGVGLFGFNIVNCQDREVVVTEGEFDAMSVYQVTGLKSVSLPVGANSLPNYLVQQFSQFDKIYLWMDNDQVGQMNVERIADKLGKERVFIVRSSYKDANEALQKADHQDILQSIQQARNLVDDNILQFENLRDLVEDKLRNFELDQGIKSTEFIFMNEYLKGIRKGEFTVFTGPTGSGKTTFLSQLTIDVCRSGLRTLFGSFEIQNQTLITSMMMQFSKVNLYNNKEQFDYYAQQFNQLPLYFLNFYGTTEIEKIFTTLEYTIQQQDLNFIVLDNLQFFMGSQANGNSRFDLQDEIIERIRKLVNRHQIHLILVIHPRKTDEKVDLQIADIFGTAKSTQEADNIFIIQNREGRKTLQLKKNRYDGDIGEVHLGYDKDTKSFKELTNLEVQWIDQKKAKFSRFYSKSSYENDSIRLQNKVDAQQFNYKNIRQRSNYHCQVGDDKRQQQQPNDNELSKGLDHSYRFNQELISKQNQRFQQSATKFGQAQQGYQNYIINNNDDQQSNSINNQSQNQLINQNQRSYQTVHTGHIKNQNLLVQDQNTKLQMIKHQNLNRTSRRDIQTKEKKVYLEKKEDLDMIDLGSHDNHDDQCFDEIGFYNSYDDKPDHDLIDEFVHNRKTKKNWADDFDQQIDDKLDKKKERRKRNKPILQQFDYTNIKK